jgi:hypothetical protein
MRIPFITLIASSALALGGCAYGDLGLGAGAGYGNYGYGYGPYGSYGSPGYGSPYGYGYAGYGSAYGYGSPYGGYGSYGSPYYGWYDNYYYPGSGSYVYDSYRQPHVWSNTQRSYWTQRQPTVVTSGGARTVRTVSPNWSGFNRSTAAAQRQSRQNARTTAQQQRQQAREDRRNQQ